MDKKAHEITLEGDAFNALKSDFNMLLRKTLSTMIQKEGEKAELKLSLKITLTQGETRDLMKSDMKPSVRLSSRSLNTRLAPSCSTKMRKADLSAGLSMSLFGIEQKALMLCAPLKTAR